MPSFTSTPRQAPVNDSISENRIIVFIVTSLCRLRPGARAIHSRGNKQALLPVDRGMNQSRRDFLKLAGLGGVVFASALAGSANVLRKPEQDDFFFVQLSDSHWGYNGPANPEAANTLRQAVAAVNALPATPDFVVWTGDLTHTTDDGGER